MTELRDRLEVKDILIRAWSPVCERWLKLGYENLSRPEQVFVAILMLEAEVDNGGFSQYIYNGAGDQGEFAPGALREVGADSIAELCEQFYAMLPGGKPARTLDERLEQLNLAAAAIAPHDFGERCALSKSASTRSRTTSTPAS